MPDDADQAEQHEPGPHAAGRRCRTAVITGDLQAESGEVAAEPPDLAQRRLALAGVPRSEGEAHLRGAELGAPHDQLEQDLVAVRPQPSRSSAASRTAKKPLIGSLTREARRGKASFATLVANRDVFRRRGTVQAGRVPVACVPAGDDEIHVLPIGPYEELRDDLRRVLKIRVHHQGPRRRATLMPLTTAVPRPPPRWSGARWSTRTACAVPPGPRYHVGGVVVGVVDEDDLGRDVAERLGQALQQRSRRCPAHSAWE